MVSESPTLESRRRSNDQCVKTNIRNGTQQGENRVWIPPEHWLGDHRKEPENHRRIEWVETKEMGKSRDLRTNVLDAQMRTFSTGTIIRKIFVIFFSVSPKLRYSKAKIGDIIMISECLKF